MLNRFIVGALAFNSSFASVFMSFDWLGGLIIFILLTVLAYIVYEIAK
jgi:hypothetical protein